jgi:hypothetical protein
LRLRPFQIIRTWIFKFFIGRKSMNYYTHLM